MQQDAHRYGLPQVSQYRETARGISIQLKLLVNNLIDRVSTLVSCRKLLIFGAGFDSQARYVIIEYLLVYADGTAMGYAGVCNVKS